VLADPFGSVIEEEAAWSIDSDPPRTEVVAVRVIQNDTASIPGTGVKPNIRFDPELGERTSRGVFTFMEATLPEAKRISCRSIANY